MKRLLFIMITASAMIISLNSCSKDNSVPLQHTGGGTGSSDNSIIINLETEHWEAKGNSIFVNLFPNIIPSKTNKSVTVYLVSDDKEILIDQRVSFMDGVLWATNTQADVVITYHGNLQPPRVKIKVVIVE